MTEASSLENGTHDDRLTATELMRHGRNQLRRLRIVNCSIPGKLLNDPVQQQAVAGSIRATLPPGNYQLQACQMGLNQGLIGQNCEPLRGPGRSESGCRRSEPSVRSSCGT
ncbi:hypothetical protein AAG906_007534 [Vitis piasezkii]